MFLRALFERLAERISGRRRRPRCPGCGRARMLPIVYGLPGPELMRDARRGRVALGGCVVTEDAAFWTCPACRSTFGARGARPDGP